MLYLPILVFTLLQLKLSILIARKCKIFTTNCKIFLEVIHDIKVEFNKTEKSFNFIVTYMIFNENMTSYQH